MALNACACHGLRPMKQRTLSLGAAMIVAASLFAPAAAAQPSPSARYTAEITAAVRRDMPALRACYEGSREEGRRAWRLLRGVSATVQADGRLAAVSMSPSGSAPAVEACVRPIIEAWRLTPPSGGAPVALAWTREEIRRAAARERHH